MFMCRHCIQTVVMTFWQYEFKPNDIAFLHKSDCHRVHVHVVLFSEGKMIFDARTRHLMRLIRYALYM